MELKEIEATCEMLRGDTDALRRRVVDLYTHLKPKRDTQGANLDGADTPMDIDGPVKINLGLVIRDLDGVRGRLGKAMETIQGGISILDK